MKTLGKITLGIAAYSTTVLLNFGIRSYEELYAQEKVITLLCAPTQIKNEWERYAAEQMKALRSYEILVPFSSWGAKNERPSEKDLETKTQDAYTDF